MTEKRSSLKNVGGAAITVRVTTRAPRNQIIGILTDGTIKIAVTAPPVDGKANQALVSYLAEITGLPAANIEIVAGLTGHNKLIAITGITSKDLVGTAPVENVKKIIGRPHNREQPTGQKSKNESAVNSEYRWRRYSRSA